MFNTRIRVDDVPGVWGSTKKKPLNRRFSGFCFGSPTWARTRDLRINSPALYRLSYRGIALNYSVKKASKAGSNRDATGAGRARVEVVVVELLG